jgi:HlyD family secretion protein
MSENMNSRIADTSSQDTYLEPRGNARRWIIAGIAGVAIVVLVVTGIPTLLRWLSSEDSISRERLRTAIVERGDFNRDISVQGTVVAAVSPTLYANQIGTIDFKVAAGDRVSEGEILAVLDSPELTNQFAQARSIQSKLEVGVGRYDIERRQKLLTNKKSVDLADLALVAARRELKRAEQAYASQGISQVDYQKAQDDLTVAEYGHAHALADAELDKERLSFEARSRDLELEQQNLLVANLQRQVNELTLISPVTGVVGNRLVKQKGEVAPSMPVISVVDLTQFEVEAYVPQNYADDLAIGMPAEVRTGNLVFAATVKSISPEIVDDQVATRLSFAGDRPEGIRQNQRLTTRILLEEKRDVLMVTRGQFLESGSGRFAFRIDDDVAIRQPITTGARSLNTVEITSGLSEGDQIIISSTDIFGDAETILITN